MSILGAALAAMVSGFLIGAAARFAVPGPDPMPFWLTVLIGLGGSSTGAVIAGAIFGADHTFDSSGHGFATLMLAVGFAAALVAAYRVLVQKRPLGGPEARRFPRRGVGIAKMRQRLHRMGIDPDRLGTTPAAPAAPATQDDVVGQLEKLRELRDAGTLTEEEYEAARERLRRY